MIVQCPQCENKYRLDEKQFAGRKEIMVRCKECGAGFSVLASEALSLEPDAPLPKETSLSEKGLQPHLPTDKNVSLAVTKGALKGQVFPVTKPRVILGRAGADIVVPDAEVSRKHCLLEIHGTTATLLDLGSTNGTFVDGEQIESRELEHMTEFRVGSTVFIFTVTNKS